MENSSCLIFVVLLGDFENFKHQKVSRSTISISTVVLLKLMVVMSVYTCLFIIILYCTLIELLISEMIIILGTCDTDRAELAELSMPSSIPFVSEPVTATLTFDNLCYHDPELDFSISMPEGSIGKEERIQFRIGACCYGPFAIPDRYLLVTDIFCVVASAQFGQGKTATVTMSHCLQMAIYQQHDALFILKADHKEVTKSDKFIFERLTNPEVVSDSPYLTFKINSFCILCGALEQRSSDSSSSESSFSRQSSLVESEPGRARTYSTDSETGKAYSRECSVESGTGAPAEPYPRTSTPETRSRSGSTRSSKRGRPRTQYSRLQAKEPGTTLEYAVILFEPVKLETSLRWPLIVFVCIFCPVITAVSSVLAYTLVYTI